VIVVDGGSVDGTPEMMASLDPVPYRLKYLRNGDFGPGSNRNLGIRNSEGDILVFVNDDVLFEPDSLQVHLDFHRRHPEPNCAMLGRATFPEAIKTTSFMKAFEPFNYAIIEGREQVDFYFFWTCYISLKKKLMLENGMFNDTVAYPAHEDVELGYRLEQKGLKILYNPKSLGYHHHSTTLDNECRHMYMMGYYFHLLWENVEDWRLYRWAPQICWRMPQPELSKAVVRHIIRLALCNGLTVPHLIRPLVGWLEKSKRFHKFATPLYWKILTYYTRKGIADGLRARSVSCILNMVTIKKKGYAAHVTG
jgi:GT2 family glycosyltransferase